MRNRYQDNQKTKRLREKNRKKREQEAKLSKVFKTTYRKEISKFEKEFDDLGACRNRLFQWKKWKLKGNILTFKCPSPSCDSTQAYVYSKKSHGKKIKAFQCMKCRKQVSLTSDTIFHKTRTPLWIWFLSIYSIGLLDGKVPVTFLKKKAQDYVDIQEIDKKVSKDQIVRITKTLKKVVFSKDQQTIDNYLELVGLPRQYRYDNFLQWYDAGDDERHSWKTGWRTRVHSRNNRIAKQLAVEKNVEPVNRVLFCKNKGGINKQDWILCFRIKDQKLDHIRWLHVSHFDQLKPERGPYRYQVIQVTEKEGFARRPFYINKKFKKVFAKSVEKYGFEEFKKISTNNITEPPSEVLELTAKIMRGGY